MVILRHLSPYLGLDCWSPQMCWPLSSEPVRGSGFYVMPEPGKPLPGYLGSYLPWLTTQFPLWALASFPGLHPKLRPRFPLVTSGHRSQQPSWSFPLTQDLSGAFGIRPLSSMLTSDTCCFPSDTSHPPTAHPKLEASPLQP